MKRCSTCNQTYTDDLMFCLSDGTPLTGLPGDVEQQTVVRYPPLTTPKHGGASSAFKYLAGGFVLLFIFVLIGGGAAAWILWPRSGTTIANAPPRNDTVLAVPSPGQTPNTSNNLNTNRTQLKEQEEELERERRKLADERKKLDDEKRRQADSVEPEPPRFNDPGTARINFRRGSVGETVSGTVGRSRSYVLRTMAGQYLTANVRSGSGCVVFTGGSASTGFTTGGGDTRLNIQNNCDTPSSYTMTVTVR